MAIGSSSDKGAAAATGFRAGLVDEVADMDFPFLAASASANNKVLYPFPEGKPVRQSCDQWPM